MVKDDTLLFAGLGIAALYLLNKPLKDVGEGVASTIGGVGGAVSDVAEDVADVTGGLSGVVVSLTDAVTNLINKTSNDKSVKTGDDPYTNVGKSVLLPPGISAIDNILDKWNKLFNNGPSIIDVKKPDTQGATPQQVKNTIDLFNAGSVVNAIGNLPQKTTSLTQPLASPSASKSVKSSSSEPTILTVYNESGNTISKATGGDLGVSKYTGNPITQVIKITKPSSSSSSSSKSVKSSSSSSSSTPKIGSSASLAKTKANIAKSKAATAVKKAAGGYN